jgi:UDPglucose 6-dehydrogenase
MSKPKIAFVGMTHLGLNSAVAVAERGFTVVGFDPDPARITPLAVGKLPVLEPQLPELFAKNRDHLTFTTNSAALAECDVVYVAPDVPTDDYGVSDLGPIRELIAIIKPVLPRVATMVILSQVPPGFTRSLEAEWPTPLYYQVETLIFGRAVERAMYPERYIVGCADPGKPLPPPFAQLLGAFGCPILPMRYESAELAKISINMCLVGSVSVANTLAELCERIGADWSEIVPALRLDKRIGPHSYIAAGLGIAGGNLERDLATVCRLADAEGTNAGIVRAMVANSGYRRHWPLRTLHERVFATKPDAVVAVLGLAYKQDTASIKNSPSLSLLAQLHPYAIRAFDPAVQASPQFHPRLMAAQSALAACEGADVLVVMTPWPEFRRLSAKAIAAKLRGRIIIDPYAALDGESCRSAGLEYITLGRS